MHQPSPDTAPPPSPLSGVVAWLRRWGRWLLGLVGLGAIAGLVVHVGPEKLGATLLVAGPWLPLFMAFDALWMVVEGGALASFYGPAWHKIPTRQWVRSLLAHYTTMILLPVGRTGAEITRATMLSSYVGSHRAAAGAAHLQALVLVANALIGVPCLAASLWAVGPTAPLTIALAINLVATSLLGGGLYAFTRRVKLGGWLGRRFERMTHWGPELDRVLGESPPVPWLGATLCLSGRVIQTVQYGLILLAVGGALSPISALLAQGIHLVGAALGDMIPNQAGATEGAYALFADALGFGDAPERALAIALVARLTGLSLAGLSFVALHLLPKGPATIAAEHPPAGDTGPEETQHA